MRISLLIALATALLVLADITQQCARTGQTSLTAGVISLSTEKRDAIVAKPRTDGERTESRFEENVFQRPMMEFRNVDWAMRKWQLGTNLGLGFLSCTLVWLIAVCFPRPETRLASSLRKATVWSMIAAVLGVAAIAAYVRIMLWDPLEERMYDSVLWEICGLIGATGGAGVGFLCAIVAHYVSAAFSPSQSPNL